MTVTTESRTESRRWRRRGGDDEREVRPSEEPIAVVGINAPKGRAGERREGPGRASEGTGTDEKGRAG